MMGQTFVSPSLASRSCALPKEKTYPCVDPATSRRALTACLPSAVPTDSGFPASPAASSRHCTSGRRRPPRRPDAASAPPAGFARWCGVRCPPGINAKARSHSATASAGRPCCNRGAARRTCSSDAAARPKLCLLKSLHGLKGQKHGYGDPRVIPPLDRQQEQAARPIRPMALATN